MLAKVVFSFLFVSILSFETPASAQIPEYQVMRATGKITIDGILDDADWAAAKPVGDFVFKYWTEGEKEQTEVKLLWDDNFLYICYNCKDKHVWADHYDTNSDTYNDDAVELFWNPNPAAGDNYYMFEFNCIGNLLSVCNDHKIPIKQNKIIPPHISQTIKGTMNNDNDEDTGWILEVAVRFADYPGLFDGSTPKDGDMWRIGLNRCGGKTNPQESQWSPSRTKSFHSPQDFGKIFFSMKKVK